MMHDICGYTIVTDKHGPSSLGPYLRFLGRSQLPKLCSILLPLVSSDNVHSILGLLSTQLP